MTFRQVNFHDPASISRALAELPHEAEDEIPVSVEQLRAMLQICLMSAATDSESLWHGVQPRAYWPTFAAAAFASPSLRGLQNAQSIAAEAAALADALVDQLRDRCVRYEVVPKEDR